MAQLHPTPTKEQVRILCDAYSNDDELCVFKLYIEHDSNAWICKRQAITSWEEAGDEVLGGGAGEGSRGRGGLFGDGLGYFCKHFPVSNCYFTVLLQDFILECKGRTGYLCMVGTGGGW